MAFEDGQVDGGAVGGGAGGGAADLLGGAAADAGGGADQGGADQGGADQGGDNNDQGGTEPDWFANVSADVGEGEKTSTRDWLKAAGVKDIQSLAKMARDNQAALRDSGRIKVPGEGASAEEIKAYRTALGVPDSAAGYEFKAPVGADGEPIELNDGTLSRIATFAHKHGLPKGPMEALVADYVAGELDDLATAQRDQDAAAQAWVKAQGSDATGKIAAIDRAAGALGLTPQDLQGLRAAWGPEKALSIMAKLGEGMAEDTMITGGKGRFGISGAEAQAEINRLTGDSEFTKKLSDPNSPESARWRRLNDAAGEAANRAAAAAA